MLPKPYTDQELLEIAEGWELCHAENRFTAGVIAQPISLWDVTKGIEIVNGKVDAREEDVLLSQMMNCAANNYMLLGMLSRMESYLTNDIGADILAAAIERIHPRRNDG